MVKVNVFQALKVGLQLKPPFVSKGLLKWMTSGTGVVVLPSLEPLLRVDDGEEAKFASSWT